MSKPMLVTAEDRTDTLLEALSKAGYLDDDWRVERDDGDGRSKAENLTLAAFRIALAAAWKAGYLAGGESCKAHVLLQQKHARFQDKWGGLEVMVKGFIEARDVEQIRFAPPAPPVGLKS